MLSTIINVLITLYAVFLLCVAVKLPNVIKQENKFDSQDGANDLLASINKFG